MEFPPSQNSLWLLRSSLLRHMLKSVTRIQAYLFKSSYLASPNKKYICLTDWWRFSAHHPKSERVIQAISRMNYIHGVYQKSGKISNNDLLYTLSGKLICKNSILSISSFSSHVTHWTTVFSILAQSLTSYNSIHHRTNLVSIRAIR